MADTKISALPASTVPLAGTEVLPIVQSSSTKQVSVANLTAGRAISATELTLTTGNLIVSNGKGIDFSATPGTGTSELLNDYEEGTWTPTDASGGGLSLTINYAKYVKIGKQVTINAFISYPANADANNATIGGLPFTIDSGSYVPAPILTNTGVSVGANLLATTATFLLVNPINASSYLNSVFNGTYITISATYFV